MFHPHWKNVALVLQEGGNIHAVDVSNGMIVNDFLAMVQMNSSWSTSCTWRIPSRHAMFSRSLEVAPHMQLSHTHGMRWRLIGRP